MTSLSAVFSRSQPSGSIDSSLAFTLLILLPSSFCSTAHAQDHPAIDVHAGMSMPMELGVDPTAEAKLLADKRESEFNHHLAGFFCRTSWAFHFGGSRYPQPLPSVRYAWPLCFILSGLFVLIWSDTELWPFGPQSWYYASAIILRWCSTRFFAVLLLALAYWNCSARAELCGHAGRDGFFRFSLWQVLPCFLPRPSSWNAWSSSLRSHAAIQAQAFQFFDGGLRDRSFEGAGGNKT